MDSFLDSCLIIHYLVYTFNKTKLNEICASYVHKKMGKFFFCFYGIGEIRRYIQKREIQYIEILKKKKDGNYKIGESKEANFILKKEEILFAEKLYKDTLSESYQCLSEKFQKEIISLKTNFQIFLKSKIDEVGIKKSEINHQILSIIHEFIADFSDCRILTSALQMQQNKEVFLFLTADKHIDPNGYDFIKDDLRLKSYKFPMLKNLLFED